MAKRSQWAIEQKASALLRECVITEPPVDLDRITKHLDAVVVSVPGDDEISGMLHRKGSQIIIGVNASHHPNRRRFSIAHECAHLRLHDKDLYLDGSGTLIHWRDTLSSLGTKDEEIEANQFAASLLMPRDLIHRDLAADIVSADRIAVGDHEAIAKLAKRYAVSPEAMRIRLVNLRLASPVE